MAGTGITHIGRTDFRGDHPTFGIKLEDRLSGAGTGGANRSGASGRRSRPNGSAKKQPRAQLALGARVLDTRGICWTGGLGGGSLRSSAPLSWDVVGSAAGRHPIVLSRSFTPTCSALGLTPKQGVATSRPSETRERRLPQHLALGAVHGASQAFQRHDRRRASLVALAAMGTIKHAAPHRSHNYQLGSKDIPCQLLAWREVLWAGFPNHPP
jgi:hypothetical protein